MIEACKLKRVESVFAWINRGMLRKHFFAHHLRGRHQLDSVNLSEPVIFYSNHSCWWDGLLAFHLSHDVFRLDGVLMMDVQQLQKYRFFRWIGAFSVDRENREEALVSIEYAVAQLQVHHRVLWMYPQGVMLPNDVRPLVFYPGLLHIAKRLPSVQLIPVVHHYEFLGEQRPEAFSSIGRVVRIEPGNELDPKSLTREFQERLTFELNTLRDDVIMRRFETFTPTLRGKHSINIAYDHARGHSFS